MNLLEPTGQSIQLVNDLLDALARELSPSDAPASLAQKCAAAGGQLPSDMSEFLRSFCGGQLGTEPALLRMSSAFTPLLPPTPDHWKSSLALAAGWREEIALLLLGSLLGQPFAWSTQQQGRLVHDVLPVREDEHIQIGTGSREKIHWHVEDAFSAFRARYIGLLCLRNPDGTATTYSVPDLTRVSASSREILLREEFFIEPDHSQAQTCAEVPDWCLPKSRRIAVLGGGEQGCELRIDPYFMPEDKLAAESRAALAELSSEIESATKEVVLQPGDCLFLDNAHSVHGRLPFTPRYDGTDRWLKRINIAARGSLAHANQVCATTIACLPN